MTHYKPRYFFAFCNFLAPKLFLRTQKEQENHEAYIDRNIDIYVVLNQGFVFLVNRILLETLAETMRSNRKTGHFKEIVETRRKDFPEPDQMDFIFVDETNHYTGSFF